jgi:hypothetical protein
MVARPGNTIDTLTSVSPWSASEGLTIHALAARCQHYRQRSESLFELAGRWSAIAEGNTDRVVLARVATHWASHAERWAERIPAHGSGTSTMPDTDDAWQRWSVAVQAVTEAGPTALGLRGLYELVAQLADELENWLAHHDPDVDAPTVRVLELIVSDLRRNRADLAGIAPEP